MNIERLTTFWKTQPSTISYHSNKEYREWIRILFHFSPNTYSNFADISVSEIDIMDTEMDEETKDELEFDMDKMNEVMEILFLATKEHSFFRELYLHAAGRMFSTDPSIGQAVVCSYDTFSWYYTCVRHFLLSNRIDDLSEYQKLQQWFSFY